VLQLEAARIVGAPAPLIMAAQNAGGAIGSAFAPSKIVVACTAAGLAGREGEVLRATLRYGLAILGVVSAAIGLWVGAFG
jgi:lactate permease